MQFKSFALAGLFAATALAETTVTTSKASSASATTSISVASGCSFTTATATAQSDLDDYSSCDALEGDLYITGDLGSAALDNVQVIYGSLIIDNATDLASFSAGALTTVTDELSLTSLTILSTLSLPVLTTVGSVNFVTLPALSSISLNTGISSINSIYISDTSLETLDGFDIDSLDTFNVNNNKNLASIDSSLKNVKVALEVSYNSDDVEVAFDQLEWANNITFRSVSSVSLAKLSKVNASIGFISTSLTDIDCSLVETIGGSLTINDNDNLEEIDFSNLTSIGGGFVITNNTALESIEGFDSLKTVGGAIQFTGNFSTVELPSLTRVSGGVDIESDAELDCDDMDDLESDGKIQGDSYVCTGASASSSTAEDASSTSDEDSSSTSGSDSSSTATASSSASSSSEGAAGSLALNAGSFAAAVAAVVLAIM